MLKPGQIKHFDFQSDIYQMRYELVENLGGNVWKCRYLEPTDEQVEMVLADKYGGEAAVLELIDRAGTTFETRFISAAAYAEYF